jgi:hypothetical protein
MLSEGWVMSVMQSDVSGGAWNYVKKMGPASRGMFIMAQVI